MIRYLRLWVAFFKNCIAREMEYRGHFIMQFMIDMVWYGVQIALFEVIYLRASSIAGLTRPEMIVFLGTLFVVDAFNMIFFSHNFWMFGRYIASGELDFYLVKPVSTFFLSFTRYPNVASWLNLAVGTSVLVYGIIQAGILITAGKLLLFLFLIVCGNMIMLAFQAIIAGITVFIVQGEGLQMIFHTLYQFGGKPDIIYTRMMRRILIYIFPMALVASYPSQILLGTMTPVMIAWNAGAAIVLLSLGIRFFNWSLKHYSGASA